MLIRRAQITDVPTMAQIINDCAEYGLMLPRSLASLYENLRDFLVAVEPVNEATRENTPTGSAASAAVSSGNGDAAPAERVVGVCGLGIVWANLAEVYALAVAPDRRGRGLGRQLVLAIIDEAEQLGIRRLMTLTYEQAFFEKLGFQVVDRQQLPLKVWSECVRCPKNQACDEIAMLRVLDEVPEVNVPRPVDPPRDKYIVPTLSTLGQGGAHPPLEDD